MKIRFAILLCLIMAAENFAQVSPSASPSPSPEVDSIVPRAFIPPPFQSLHYEENYAYLKDKSKRTESLDKLKYIPLGKDDWYLSIGGEARLRYETYRNAAFGSGAQDSNGYLLQRYLLHSDWHFGKNFRVFAQLQSGIINNRNGGARPTDKDVLDIHQAFFEVKLLNSEKSSFTIRAGRQEIEIGSGRLTSASEGRNIRRGFDAIRAIYKQEKWTVNGLFAKLVEIDAGTIDNQSLNDQTFWGVGIVRSRQRGGLSFSYLGLDRKNGSFNQGAAREIRQTFVTRVWGVVKELDYNYELIGQSGSFGGGKIRAFAVVSDTGFNLPETRFSPRFGLRASISSGDKNRNDGNLQSFNPLFPGTAYSGAIALVGPTNIMDLTPSVRLDLTKKIRVSLDSAFYWRQSLNDGLYGINVNLQRTGNLSRERFVGGLPSARFDYRINRHWTWTAIYSHFFVGRFLRETPPGRDVDYFSTWTTFRF